MSGAGSRGLTLYVLLAPRGTSLVFVTLDAGTRQGMNCGARCRRWEFDVLIGYQKDTCWYPRDRHIRYIFFVPVQNVTAVLFARPAETCSCSRVLVFSYNCNTYLLFKTRDKCTLSSTTKRHIWSASLRQYYLVLRTVY